MVLPTDAVVKEGADAFVFRQNGKLFERVPVVIAYEDAAIPFLPMVARSHQGM